MFIDLEWKSSFYMCTFYTFPFHLIQATSQMGKSCNNKRGRKKDEVNAEENNNPLFSG